MSKEDIEEQFNEFGVTVTPQIIAKCVDLCKEYDITDASALVEEWMAYTVSKLGGADPTIDTICDMVRAEFSTQKQPSTSVAEAMDEGEVRIYGGSQDDDGLDDAIMDSYIEGVPMSPRRKIAQPRFQKTPRHVFSPASYSPISLQDKKVNEQAGNAVVTFGQSQLVKVCQWTAYRGGAFQVLPSKWFKNIPKNERFMTDEITLRAMLMGDNLYQLTNSISERLKSQGANEGVLGLQHCNMLCKEKIMTAGQILIEDGVVDKYSVFLVGIDETTFRKVKLDFSKCKSYSVFPGEVVLVEGSNPRGDNFVVDQIYAATTIVNCPRIQIPKPISMIVCSGPYTSDDVLTYSPLEDLVKYCNENPPDILIMTGAILSSNMSEKTLLQVAERYDRHFEKFLQKLVSSLNPNTKILLVSSNEDVNATCVYPTHPYRTKGNHPNLHLLPDPCVVDIDGLHVGITSTDVLGELSEREVSFNDGIDKVKRASHYLFHQKSFYPLRPTKEIPLDITLAAKYTKLDTLPHMMIMPSSLKEFIRDYSNCLCVNPGKLYGGNGESGKFARIVFRPPENDAQKLYNYVSGQVLKI